MLEKVTYEYSGGYYPREGTEKNQCFTLPSAFRPGPAQNCLTFPSSAAFQPALNVWETGPGRPMHLGEPRGRGRGRRNADSQSGWARARAREGWAGRGPGGRRLAQLVPDGPPGDRPSVRLSRPVEVGSRGAGSSELWSHQGILIPHPAGTTGSFLLLSLVVWKEPGQIFSSYAFYIFI